MSDEAVDPKPEIEEGCKSHCQKHLAALEACTERTNKAIAEAKPGEEVPNHCTGQYHDFWHCIDHCAAPKLFKELK
eukprot:CAMPEP_0184309916 /NCGR_PEP_ID=MMETSP1049-20130417/21210_1 /TAXON_ID=77928 /ORGANISM="Proteomonas sulcata, Strain CCMP704" /LENGTH=75 /DNA_ID=CAMNT_0026623177 /DNA_START=12 /DNA_END=239 /DNA_ORIENTATION=+